MSFQRWIVGSIIGTTLFAFGLARPASASVIWRGDYSTGNVKQWSGTEMVSADRLQVVQDPLGSETKVLKAIVKQGDDPINSSGNRNEVIYTGDDVGDGTADRYYHWRTMWPTDYSSEDTWQLFTQWHQYDGGGSPPLEFYVRGEKVNVNVRTTGELPTWSTPLQRGVWHDFVAHVRWSTNASVGYVELWYDGTLVMPKKYGATLYGSDGVYMKQGLYRDEAISATQTVYHSGTMIGTTLDDVWPVTPPPAPAPDAGPAPTTPDPTAETPTTETPTMETPSAVSKLKEKAGCSQPGFVGWLGVAPMLYGLIRRRRVQRPSGGGLGGCGGGGGEMS